MPDKTNKEYAEECHVEMTQLVLLHDTYQRRDLLIGKRRLTDTAFLTFVAVTKDERPVNVKRIIPQSKDENRKFRDALIRGRRRLNQRKYR
jgi:acyl-CoA hydrolase